MTSNAKPVFSSNNLRISFLGPVASFSHQATNTVFPDDEHNLEPVSTIEEIFETVQAGNADFGVVPFENSSHGLVTTTLDGLADRDNRFSGLSVCGEIFLVVHHYLLGRKTTGSHLFLSNDPSSPIAGKPQARHNQPVGSLKHIDRIYSHPQALGQTVGFWRDHLPGVERIEVSSTSKAAELVAQDNTGRSAAISSQMAANKHNLDVLAECIEDRQDNTTRFFIIRKGNDDKSTIDRQSDMSEVQQTVADLQRAKYQSLVSFVVPHQSPAGLADVLDCFRRFKLNVTSINSLPSWIKPFQHLFLVEFEGSKLQDPDGKVKKALDDMSQVTQSWRWLGSWENRWY